jgi:hypothetical protein
MDCLADRWSDSTNNDEEEIIAKDSFVVCDDGWGAVFSSLVEKMRQ